MKINFSIFKKYDIRGIYPQEINNETAYLLGRAFSCFLKETGLDIVVGTDDEQASLEMKKSLVNGILDSGNNVVDIGFSSSPMLYFTVAKFGFKAGIQVTASHLSSGGYTGLKLVGEEASPVGEGTGLEDIKEVLVNEKIGCHHPNKGRVIKKDILSEYVKEVRGHLDEVREMPRMKIVMDSGNGMSALSLSNIFQDTPIDIVPLFWEMNSIRGRGSNPKILENRQKAMQKIQEENADLGFMWDEDADRFYALDNKGKVIDPNFVSFLIAKYLIQRSKNKKIVVDIRSSRILKKEIEENGGEVFFSKTWHSEIKLKMRETGAIFGSETSGHYIFKDFYYIDDGVLASIYFLRALTAEKRDVPEVLKDLRTRHFILPERNFEIKDKKRAKKILNSIRKFYKNKKGEVSMIDGVSISFPSWYFNLRPSQTESCLRLNLGASSEKMLGKKEKELTCLIKKGLE